MASRMLKAAALLVSVVSATTTTNLPIVDLGYERHQAISFNETGGFYNFSNIRFAEPPIGELRFRAPVAVTGKSTTVNNGSVGHICPQADPAWGAITALFVPDYLEGIPFNLTAAEIYLANMSTGVLPKQDPRTSEDCLFLDVYPPKKVFQQAPVSAAGGQGAPVLVWIYGGGYTFGDKNNDGEYNPAGLIKASQISGSDGIVFVALNYRLGAFGWLGGPTLQSDGTANAGLYDQRLALEWVQENIHLFGGDKNRVTIMGESAGGGSITHQITAYGGLGGKVPFHQAIPQSPAWQLIPGNAVPENTTQIFLKMLNVSTVADARKLPSMALIIANIIQVGGSQYGDFTFGPLVDGSFVPAPPGKLLLQGNFHKNLNILVGHNADEGLDFTNPAITNNTIYNDFVLVNFPDIQTAAFDYITQTLYPPIFDGSQGYKDEIGRAVKTISESSFICNTNYLDRAFLNKTYAYQFDVFPALHGQDVPYTFYNGPNPSVANDTVAIALQEYITSFVETGTPSAPHILKFPMYGSNSQIIDLGTTKISQIMDDVIGSRCEWWQKALYY
ncbi:MAG: hypothetical protein MMC33_006210 [Icmadophila ericetorum]|nr:hypothetical protein [Icmadophila ericetorum]